MKKNAIQGFTIIELAITVLVLSILMAIAIPSFRVYIQNTRLTTGTNDLVADLNVSRSSAIGRNVCVIACRAGNTSSGSEACGGTAKNWSSGWLIYTQGSCTSSAFATYSSGTHTLVRVHAAVHDDLNIRTNNAANQYIKFKPDGTLYSTAGAIFAVCDDRGTANGRQLTIGITGHTSLNRAGNCNP